MNQKVEEIGIELDGLIAHAQVLQNKLEDDMTSGAIDLIKEMLAISGATLDEDLETEDTQVDAVMDNFVGQWNALGFDVDNIADLLEG